MAAVLWICCGASAGAVCRWLASSALNPLFAAIPPGTLVVNWLGSLIMGAAISLFAQLPALNPAWRLFLVTGFLGSFTTFSAFSAETGALVLEGRLWFAALTAGLHVFGSVLMFFIGLWLAALARNWLSW